jgi:hypothetical protein
MHNNIEAAAKATQRTRAYLFLIYTIQHGQMSDILDY